MENLETKTNTTNSKWPTLEGRLNQPLTSRGEALRQMKANGDILSPLAERYLEKFEKEELKKIENSKRNSKRNRRS